jgi:hypothetical protein
MIVLGVVILAGAVLMVRQRQILIPFCCAMTAGAMCLTPWPEQFVRYFTPMVPFLSIMLIAALGAVIDVSRTKKVGGTRWVGHGFALAILTLVFVEDAFVTWLTFRAPDARRVIYYNGDQRTSGSLLFYRREAAALDDALEQVRHRAKAGDVMATTMPHWGYLRTGVKAILPPMGADQDEARRMLDSVPVRFMVLDNLAYPLISRRYAAPAVEAHPDLWKQIYQTEDGQASVYERTR